MEEDEDSVHSTPSTPMDDMPKAQRVCRVEISQWTVNYRSPDSSLVGIHQFSFGKTLVL